MSLMFRARVRRRQLRSQMCFSSRRMRSEKTCPILLLSEGARIYNHRTTSLVSARRKKYEGMWLLQWFSCASSIVKSPLLSVFVQLTRRTGGWHRTRHKTMAMLLLLLLHTCGCTFTFLGGGGRGGSTKYQCALWRRVVYQGNES